MLGNVALIMGNVELKMLMYNLKYIQIDWVTESSLHSYQLVENLVSAALTYSHFKSWVPQSITAAAKFWSKRQTSKISHF